MRALTLSCAALLLAACTAPRAERRAEPEAPGAAAAGAALPETPRRPVVDTYHGVDVEDPYRWLEDGASPEVQDWMQAQDAYARAWLEALPGRDALFEEVRRAFTAQRVRWGAVDWRPGHVFALRRDPELQQPQLVVMADPARPEAARVLVDPNALDAEGTTAIDFYLPSPDGRHVAVSLSKGGTESGDLHFFETDTGRPVFEVIPRVNGGTAGGDAAWTADGRGVYYTRYPRPGEREGEDLNFYQQLWFHALGTPVEEDRYELGRELPRIAEIAIEVQPGGAHVLATVQDGDSGRFSHFLRSPEGAWRKLTDFGDGISAMVFGPREDLYLLSRRDAPKGRMLHLPLSRPDPAAAREVIPEGEDSIDWHFSFANTIVVTADRLFLVYQTGGPTELRAFHLDGRPAEGPDVPEVSTVDSPVAWEDGLLFWRVGFAEPAAWYAFRPGPGTTEKTALATESDIRFDDVEVRRAFATSRDGTRVPYVVLMPRDAPLDGDRPTLVTGYGGYAVSLSPAFMPTMRPWIDRGGLFVIANVRGGGEYGEQWHRQGMGLDKQNTFDDFAAVLRALVDGGYTRSERLAIEGGSNGGILMGAIITQHPGLVRAVVSSVGVYDMLRSELTPNGQFNVPEYGTVKDEAQFRALHAYSPYHRVEPGTPYPAVLLTAGANDPRVDTLHSRKFAAALQHATTSDRPVLLRVDYAGGHGLDTPQDEAIAQTTDIQAFLLHALGMTGADAPDAE